MLYFNTCLHGKRNLSHHNSTMIVSHPPKHYSYQTNICNNDVYNETLFFLPRLRMEYSGGRLGALITQGNTGWPVMTPCRCGPGRHEVLCGISQLFYLMG